MKVGMISFAHMHAIHYLHLLQKRDDVEIVGIADEDWQRVEPYVGEGKVYYYADYHQLLQTDVEVIIICSENVHHAELTIASARAGKHILCEKPLGISREEMQRMIDVCKEQNVQLMTAFPNRYLQSVRQAKHAIDQGNIGEVIAIKATNKGEMPGGWFIDQELSGGGALLDHSVHVMDIMNWILGSQVTEVYAEMGTLFHDIPIDDSGMIHVTYDNGVIAVLDTSWSRAASFPFKRDITMEIFGTKGAISLDVSRQVNEVYSDKTRAADWSLWGDDKDELMLNDFFRALNEATAVPISGEDGMNSAMVALTAYESVRLGKPIHVKKR